MIYLLVYGYNHFIYFFSNCITQVVAVLTGSGVHNYYYFTSGKFRNEPIAVVHYKMNLTLEWIRKKIVFVNNNNNRRTQCMVISNL